MISYNGKLINQELSSINVINRAFLFGDGLFETLIYSSGKLRHFNFHWDRLNEGINSLGLEVSFSKHSLHTQILATVEAQNIISEAFRIKLTLWRAGGGKYTPETNLSEYLIKAEPTNINSYSKIAHCKLAKTVTLYPHAYSHLKTISALNYVLAAKEKYNRKVEELCLQSHDGQLAEATSANIFVYDHLNNQYLTPPLSSGCINGVMRRAIIHQLAQENVKVVEQPIFLDRLGKNYSLILTNVTGIRLVATLEGVSLNTDESIALKLATIASH